jgi:hydroxymethylpyrimidine/phosphomethylpyrimidine kinase
MQTALTIAGSDSGGGAGIQADLKTFAAHHVYGTCAITAVTAQNTVGVRAWEALSVDVVLAQIYAVTSDIGADAIKIGMLANVEIIRAVSLVIDELDLQHVVIDPVMIAQSGDRLLAEDAIDELKTGLLPRAHVVTPNIPEAEVLTGRRIRSLQDMHDAAAEICDLGPRVVLVKGGHADGPESIDVACLQTSTLELRGPRIGTRNTHGTGCTLSAAIAANLANGLAEEDALREARRYLEGAIRYAPDLGAGHGPLNHFWRTHTSNE